MKLFNPTVQGQEAIRQNIGLGDMRKQNLLKKCSGSSGVYSQIKNKVDTDKGNLLPNHK